MSPMPAFMRQKSEPRYVKNMRIAPRIATPAASRGFAVSPSSKAKTRS